MNYRRDLALLVSLLVVMQQAEDVVLLELGAALEEVEFDGEADAGALRKQILRL